MGALLFRVDASPAIGMGHAMRCLALAQAWKDRGNDAVFLMAESRPAVDAYLRVEGFDLVQIRGALGSPEDALETAEAARTARSGWVVVDGYRFGESYHCTLKAAGLSVLAIDDYGHVGECSADLILNQNLHARVGLYRDCSPGTRLLIGPRFALLRREFRDFRRPGKRPGTQAGSIVVTLGGADPHNVMDIVLRGLAKLDRRTYHVTAVVSPMNDSGGVAEAMAQELKLPARFERDVRDMPRLMADADIAIAGSGTTAWELAYLGIPSLLIVLADNQGEIAESLELAGVAENLGPWQNVNPLALARAIRALLEDPIRRKRMTERGEKLIDGSGADRVLRALSVPPLVLRAVRDEDSRQVWEWSNEPGTRAASFSTEPIPWEDHVRWFRARLENPRCHFYLASDPTGREVGQIRFDPEDGEAEVSVSLDPEVRGRGYGVALIQIASRKLFAESGVRTIHAYTKEANEVSVRVFLDAGYTDRGATEIRGHRALHFALTQEADR